MKKTFLIFALLGLHLFLLSNLRFTAWPEMLSYAYLKNNGFVLYKDFIHPYPPALTICLAFIYKLFGYKLLVLKAITWLIILTNDILIFLIVKKLTQKNLFSFLSLAIYVFLQPFLEGNMLWFDLAIVPPILVGVLFLLQEKSQKNLLVAGFALALAALIKQTIGIFLILACFYLLTSYKSFKIIQKFLFAPFVLGFILVTCLVKQGILDYFLAWTLWHPIVNWEKFPGYVQMALSKKELLIVFLLLALFVSFIKSKRMILDKKVLLLILFLLGGLLSVYPRFSFFHFQTALVFVIITFGYFVSKVKVKKAFALVYLGILILAVHKPVLARDWGKEARFYGLDDLDLAQIIKQKVAVDEKVFLLGLHSGLYVLAERLPPKPWTDNFGWYLEIADEQEAIITRWEEDSPKIIFWQKPASGNWFDLATYQPQKITKWIKENYTKEEEIKEGLWLWQRKS